MPLGTAKWITYFGDDRFGDRLSRIPAMGMRSLGLCGLGNRFRAVCEFVDVAIHEWNVKMLAAIQGHGNWFAIDIDFTETTRPAALMFKAARRKATLAMVNREKGKPNQLSVPFRLPPLVGIA